MKEVGKRRCGPIRHKRYGTAVHWTAKAIWEVLVDLSRMSGIGKDSIRRWARGACAPRIDHVEAVLNTLGYDLKIEKRVK